MSVGVLRLQMPRLLATSKHPASTPTLIGCQFLKSFAPEDSSEDSLLDAADLAISEDRDSGMNRRRLSSIALFVFSVPGFDEARLAALGFV